MIDYVAERHPVQYHAMWDCDHRSWIEAYDPTPDADGSCPYPPEVQEQLRGKTLCCIFYTRSSAERYLADPRLPGLFQALFDGASTWWSGASLHRDFTPVFDTWRRILRIGEEYIEYPSQ